MLEQFLEEYCAWKNAAGDPVEFTPDGAGAYWLVLGDTVHRICVSLIPMDDSQDDQALVVESPVGTWSEQLDVRSLLLLAGSKMYVSRFALCPRDLEDILVVESAVPYGSANFPLFDRMLREVLSIVVHLLTPAAEE